MTTHRHWMSETDLALFTDLYQLTMLQAYWETNMDKTATFSLFFRELPPHRRFMLACGQQNAAALLSKLRFTDSSLNKLAQLGGFKDDFLRYLEDFRFTGDIYTVPEGTPVFVQEPLLEVTAPIAQAQLLESVLMNLVHLETVLATKASRMVMAAAGRPVVDFGMRRMQGTDAAIQAVRAYKIAGIAASSNVLAAPIYELPANGTMAHSFIQACGDETTAFKAFAKLYPGTTLLVDTYDSLLAIDKIIHLKQTMGNEFNIGAIRIDSGDLGKQAKQIRDKLDNAGMNDVRIIVSGGLNEYKIAELIASQSPIDGFGVGTELGTSGDSPTLDLVYKLTEYNGEPRLKNAPGKLLYPGEKQIYRHYDEQGALVGDEVTLRHEQRASGTPLLTPTIKNGELVTDAIAPLDEAARYAAQQLAGLPYSSRCLEDGSPDYSVELSPALMALREEALANI